MNGLKSYNLTYDEVKKWKYMGGNRTPRHRHWWTLSCPDEPFPEPVSECVCGHKIVENCYITNEKETEILILGNCCINRFIPKCSRTCSKCGSPHKNRTTTECNNCRTGVCKYCRNECNYKFKCCFSCFVKGRR